MERRVPGERQDASRGQVGVCPRRVAKAGIHAPCDAGRWYRAPGWDRGPIRSVLDASAGPAAPERSLDGWLPVQSDGSSTNLSAFAGQSKARLCCQRNHMQWSDVRIGAVASGRNGWWHNDLSHGHGGQTYHSQFMGTRIPCTRAPERVGQIRYRGGKSSGCLGEKQAPGSYSSNPKDNRGSDPRRLWALHRKTPNTRIIPPKIIFRTAFPGAFSGDANTAIFPLQQPQLVALV